VVFFECSNHAGYNQPMQSIRSFIGDIWQAHRKRTFIVLVAMSISISVGFIYQDDAYIHLGPIVWWLYAILMAYFALRSNGQVSISRFRFDRRTTALLLLLAVGLSLRMFNLRNFPAAFLPDESGSLEFSLYNVFNPALGSQTIHPLRTGLDAQPVLYSYILRLSVELFGFTFWGVRMSSVIAGTLSIAAVYFMIRQFDRERTAWFAAILMAAYHFHIHWSRISLSNIWTTLFLPLTLGFFIRGWRESRDNDALLAGLCLGLTAYFYTGGYILIFLIGAVIWQIWRTPHEYTRFTLYTGKMLTLTTVVAAPLMVFALLNPASFLERASTVFAWKPGTTEILLGPDTTSWDLLVYQFTHSFGAFNIYPDVTHFYAPDVPFLIGISSLLFLIGIPLAIGKKKWLPLFWILIVTLFGGMMSAGTPGSSHFTPVIPAICWLVAIPLNGMAEAKQPRWAYILLAAIIVTDIVFYFWIYPSNSFADFTVPFPIVAPYGN